MIRTTQDVLTDLDASLKERALAGKPIYVMPNADRELYAFFFDQVIFYYDLGDAELHRAICDADGFWLDAETDQVQDGLSLLRLNGSQTPQAVRTYYFGSRDGYETHQYWDAILDGLAKFYERLRVKYAGPAMYIHRLKTLGIYFGGGKKAIRFAWDPIESAAHLDRLRRHHRKMNPPLRNVQKKLKN